MFPIVGLVGPSGSGKSTIITEAIKQIPDLAAPLVSTSTRPRRGPEDDVYYEFVTQAEIEHRIRQGRAINISQYAGNTYIYDREVINEILNKRCGLNAVVESSLEPIKQAGYKLLIVKVIPAGKIDQRSEERIKADAERAKLEYTPNLIIENNFTDANGLEKAVKQLVQFIKQHAKA